MNTVMMSGRLGRDMEVRVGRNKEMEGNFSIALSDYIGKDEAGAAKYWTTWVNVVLRGTNRVTALQDELTKGRFVVVEGQLRTWESKPKTPDEKPHTVTYVLADEVEFDRKASPSKPKPAQSAQGQDDDDDIPPF
jgi:single stranded DNA-binding protein